MPIKLEVVREDRIALSGQTEPDFPIPMLSRSDMYAEKLLANTDRWADRSTHNRDLIDLGMMVYHWGAIPPEAWLKAAEAYGDSVERRLQRRTTSNGHGRPLEQATQNGAGHSHLRGGCPRDRRPCCHNSVIDASECLESAY